VSAQRLSRVGGDKLLALFDRARRPVTSLMWWRSPSEAAVRVGEREGQRVLQVGARRHARQLSSVPSGEVGQAAVAYESLARCVEHWRHELTAAHDLSNQPPAEVER
jgi:hypothetical protein